MKINKLIVAALSAALIFTACSKEEGVDGSAKQPSKASIMVKFDLSKTRAFDNISGDDSDKQDYVTIKEAVILLVKGDGTIAACDYVGGAGLGTLSTGVLFEDVTTAISKVIVCTNVGINEEEEFEDITGMNISLFFENFSSLTHMEKMYFDDEMIASYGEATIASSDWEVSEIPGENDDVTIVSKANVAITEVNPILSRVDFSVDVTAATGWFDADDAEGIPDDASYVVMKGAALLYSAAYSYHIAPFTPSIATLGTTVPLVSGLLPEDESEWDVNPRAVADLYKNFASASEDNFLQGTWTGDWNTEDNLNGAGKKFSRSFYAFPPNDMYPGANSSLKAKPIITAYAERHIWDDEAGDGSGAFKEETEMIFWPIHFDGVSEYGGETLTMENGNRYVINIKLLGDLSNKETHNTGTPETYYLANVNVTVSEAKWKAVVSIDETFGEVVVEP